VYPHGHHPSVLRSHGWRTAENSAGYLLPRLHPSDRLLDVGVGPGTITVDLAARLPAGGVIGIDNAAAALEATRALAEAREVTNLTLQAGDAYALDFEADSFDVVHAHQVLQHLADPVAALREMRRVCRPGGLVAVRDADYAAMTWYPDHPALSRWRMLSQQLARAGGGEPEAGRRLKTWAVEAGFGQVESSASAWCFSAAADLAWWSETWAERLLSSALARQAIAAGLADQPELAHLAAGWREWAEHTGAWFAVLHGEILARD
jgi:SAM-dependent methyltransferase